MHSGASTLLLKLIQDVGIPKGAHWNRGLLKKLLESLPVASFQWVKSGEAHRLRPCAIGEDVGILSKRIDILP